VSLYEGTRVWGKRHWREREPRGRGRYTRLGRRCRKCGNAIPRCEDETYPQETTDASESAEEQQGRGEPWSAAGGAGGRTETLVAEVVRRMSEQEPVRIPKEVLEELESVRRYTRAEVLDIPTIRHVAMETHKPALVVWIDKHEQEYGLGLLNGFRAED
jgi:hypothetical protein